MILVPQNAPILRAVVPVAESVGLLLDDKYLAPLLAIGSRYDRDALDEPWDPTIDRASLTRRLIEARVSNTSASRLAELLVDREEVLDLSSQHLAPYRPATLFEYHALIDVVGEELARLLPASVVAIQRHRLSRGLNDCTILPDGQARIRLLVTNGVTLAGRTHALVHELGHALIGTSRRLGKSYAAPYGQVDYGLWLDEGTWDRVMDEEALVRALADAWLLRRRAVAWTRTTPGGIDACGTTLDGDWLAAFVRFRLRQGLGLSVPAADLRWLRMHPARIEPSSA